MLRSRKILIAVVAILALVGFGLMVAQDQETLRVRSAHTADDPRYVQYVAALAGGSFTRGDAYRVLTNGDEVFPAMLDAIKGARRRISFESYIYSTGKVPSDFTRELAAAARRGVEVRIVVDAIGASMSDEDKQTLEQAGCRVVAYNPTRWYSLEDVNYRTHRKILVVDGEIGFTGGVGLDDQWLGNAQDKAHWRDTHNLLTGPGVRELEAGFYENWIESGREVKPVLDPAPAPTGSAQSVVVWSSPTAGASRMKMLYLLTVAAAIRTLDIQSPYFVTDESTTWGLEQAVRRGVRVRILVEGDITDARPVKYASRASYDALLSLGVQVYEYEPTMMHTKAVMADGRWSIIGSANFDNRSLELNDELNIGISDAGLAARLTTDFEADLRRSHRLTLEEWRRRPFLDKVREHFWSYFGEVF